MSDREAALQRLTNVQQEIEAVLEQPEKEPVAWRDHVEQRLLTWRQSFVNRSGDQLALDDFMDKESLDDLIDYVCDEYTATTQAQRKTLTEGEIIAVAEQTKSAEPGTDGYILPVSFARAIEAKLKEKNHD